MIVLLGVEDVEESAVARRAREDSMKVRVNSILASDKNV